MSKKIRIILLAVFLMLIMSNESYARYVISKELNTNLNTAPFYFEVTPPTNIIFPRTAQASDSDTILTTETSFNLIIKNNDGTHWNEFATNYEIEIIDSPKYSFSGGNKVTKTINGGTSGKINDTITLNLKINDLTNPSKEIKLRITSTSPYKKSIDLTLRVVQEGAIQTIEDLLDFSLAVRNDSKSKMYNPSNAISERFKLTRDLDFSNPNSYENAYRTDYGNTNLDEYTNNLITEMTSDAGFLPIGMLEYKFKGVFNGGNKTISNLLIFKSLQINIGLFGNTEGATLKNFTIASGIVENRNQTAGMVVGSVQGGLIENVIVDGASVISRDLVSEDRDTYTGGIAGHVEKGATIRNCTNSASVTTRFTGDIVKFSGPAGGITAWMAQSTIENCVNNGTITGQSYVGGIAGFASMSNSDGSTTGGTIRGCTNNGEVTIYYSSGKYLGGIAGFNARNGVVTGNTNSSSAYVHGPAVVGGIVGSNSGTVSGNTSLSSVIQGSTTYSSTRKCGSGTCS